MGEIHDLVIRVGKDEAKKIVPVDDRPLIDMAAEFLGDEDASLSYMYSGFAFTSLPHRALGDNEIWERRNGRLSLIVEPGVLFEGDRTTKYGVPYGSRARLIMFYLQSEAIKTKSPIIRLGNSMTDWMVRMNINPGGSNFAAVRDQAKRLSACRLTVGWMSEDGGSGFQRENIVSGMITPPTESDQRQGRLWEQTAQLSDGFFNALLKHPVPCEERALRCIQNSSSTIDVYVWLSFRLHTLKQPVLVPWVKLHEQFGPQYKTVRQFKPRFIDSIREALVVYPEARVELEAEGVRLKPSPPAVMERKVYALPRKVG